MLKSVFKLMGSPFAREPITVRVLADSFHGTLNPSKNVHTTTVPLGRVMDRSAMLNSMPKVDDGTEGEKLLQVDQLISREDIFPDENTPNRLFKGVPFKELPIANIKSTANNTIITVTDSKGVVKLLRSCGIEGFKNTRKGTNIAAQATAITIGLKAINQGIKTVRVRIQGIGPGRMSAIKGLQMSGMDIVSITDNTHVSWNPPRPRKARRL